MQQLLSGSNHAKGNMPVFRDLSWLPVCLQSGGSEEVLTYWPGTRQPKDVFQLHKSVQSTTSSQAFLLVSILQMALGKGHCCDGVPFTEYTPWASLQNDFSSPFHEHLLNNCGFIYLCLLYTSPSPRD